jgi:SCY1-like protein 1
MGSFCRDEYLAMGMLHMASAVSFINNDCKLVSANP